MHLPSDPVAGERAVAVHPRPAADLGGWARRLRFWPGRTLTADALALESRHRAAHLALAATSYLPGVVSGLALAARETRTRSGTPAAPASDWWLHVTPGLGLVEGGDDVVLARPLDVSLDDLPVVGDPTLIDGAAPTRARGLGIVVLQPVEFLVEGQRADASLACSDPNDDAYADRRTVEGCRVAWVPWPTRWLRPPTRGQRFRNVLAQRVFAAEADGQVPPWQRFGVPLAVLDVTAVGNVLFVDRHLVQRAGGGDRPSPLLPGHGHPALWQARVRQFADHLADLAAANLSPQDAEARFAFLPPFAAIPRGLVDFGTASIRSDFLPPTLRTQAVPVPLEQLELLLESVAGMAPIDLDNGDDVTVYVPVPQRLYDPRLLHTDSIDPAFLAAVAATGIRVAEWKRRRSLLLPQAYHIRTALDRTTWTAPGTDDPGAVPGEPADASTVTPAETDHALPVRTRLTTLDTALRALGTFLHAEISERLPLTAWTAAPATPEPAATALAGLRLWITALEGRIRSANDQVNYGFLRAQSDIYRVRQLMLGNVEATRLAVSPALASIAKGDSASATAMQLGTYFKAVTAPVQQMQTFALKIGTPTGGGDAQPAVGGNAGSNRLAGSSARDQDPPRALNLGGGQALMNFALPGLQFTTPTATVVGMLNAFATGGVGTGAVVGDITGQRPLTGKLPALRTTTVVERLKDPPAPDAKNAAVASRLAVIADLVKLHPGVRLDGVRVPLAGQHVAVLPPSWVTAIADQLPKQRNDLTAIITNRQGQLAGGGLEPAQRATIQGELDAAIERRGAHDRVQTLLSNRLVRSTAVTPARFALHFTRAAVAERRDIGMVQADWTMSQQGAIDLLDPDLMRELGEGLFDPDPDDGDEGEYYSAAVTAQELAISALRAVEARIDIYERALDLIRIAANDIAQSAAGYDARVQTVATELAEARHDFAVAVALRDEEQARITAVNARRRTTLDRHVPQLVVARTRSVAAVDDLAAAPCDRVWSDPLPEAFAAAGTDLPDEIEDAVGNWRRAPLAWLPRLRDLADRLGRPETLRHVVMEAKLRAQVRVQSAPVAPLFAGPVTQQVLLRVQSGWQQLIHRRYQATAELDLDLVAKRPWSDALRTAREHLSLDDLCAAGRGTPDLAKAAGAELARVTGVAATLHRYVGQVPVAVRLAWAEAVSVFDRVIDLRELSRLPGFAGLNAELRRDLQRLATWIFTEVDRERPEAVQLATDLVRVAILLACHAPVGALLTARFPRPAVARIGDLVPITIDVGRARIGQALRLVDGVNTIGRAVVADLGERSANIRLVSASALTLNLGASVRVLSA